MPVAMLLVAGGCGSVQRGTRNPGPGTTLPRIFDASSVYRSMGMLVSSGALPYVASVWHLRGPTADSTLVLFSMSLANQALTFRRSESEFVAGYHIDLAFRSESAPLPVRQIARDEQVRVRSFQETLRGDESVVFQQFVTLAPGVYTVQATVRDRNGPNFSRAEAVDTAPQFAERSIASPIAVYEAKGRAQSAALPEFITNPRSTLPYGADTVRFYVEVYGQPAAARLVARVVDVDRRELWRDTLRLTAGAGIGTATVAVAPDQLPVGQAALEVTPSTGGDTTRARFLVSFSNQWVITNFDEMLSLLRYFDRQTWVDSLRKTPVDKRPVVWREFWKATDPVTITPENEALDDYFQRVQLANLRFTSEGEPGWLTDRGEVFITLGEPNEIYDQSSGMDRSGLRYIRWLYSDLRIVLYFQDQTGFGNFRLTPASRAEFQRALVRVRHTR
jgi:GWxTD domain-containing protein